MIVSRGCFTSTFVRDKIEPLMAPPTASCSRVVGAAPPDTDDTALSCNLAVIPDLGMVYAAAFVL